MARFGLLVLLAAALGSVIATPVEDEQVLLAEDKRWDWSDCGTDSHIVHIKSIEVSPDPPERGQDLTITVEGVADQKVEEGAYADVTVKAGVIRLLHKEFDICEEARNANASIQCPVEKGTHKVVQTVTLPKEIPPAQFKVEIRGFTETDDDLLCSNLMMDFRPRRGSYIPW
ncbi:ML domain-containing protein [Cerioporus squamosus]|nr:ML domain-containing protein [Cerioporus squamosus]